MRNLFFAAVSLTAIAGAAPASAQAGPSAYEPTAAVHGPVANATGGHWALLQGYGKDGKVIFTWYYARLRDLGRYH